MTRYYMHKVSGEVAREEGWAEHYKGLYLIEDADFLIEVERNENWEWVPA